MSQGALSAHVGVPPFSNDSVTVTVADALRTTVLASAVAVAGSQVAPTFAHACEFAVAAPSASPAREPTVIVCWVCGPSTPSGTDSFVPVNVGSGWSWPSIWNVPGAYTKPSGSVTFTVVLADRSPVTVTVAL